MTSVKSLGGHVKAGHQEANYKSGLKVEGGGKARIEISAQLTYHLLPLGLLLQILSS